MHGEWVLGSYINDSFTRAHNVTADDHALQQRVWIALDLVPIHVGAGIAFIGIANDVFVVGFRLGHELPLITREISGSAASPQLRSLDLFDYDLGAAVDEHTIERLVSANRDVFLDVVGINEPAIPQNNLLLALEER